MDGTRLLGIDYGEKRIGLALSDSLGMFASPYKVLHQAVRKLAVAEIATVCHEQECNGIVLGYPLNMDGSRGNMAVEVEAFAELLREACGIPVVLWDERLSSAEAERVLLAADLSRGRRRQVIDKVAAQMILQSYLDRQPETTGSAGGAPQV